MSALFADIYDGTPGYSASTYKKAGHEIIAIKASEGRNSGQPDHHSWSMESHAEGLSVIHYHFARPDDGNSPESEAAWFRHSMGGDLHEGDWVALDFERFLGGGPSADVDWINRFWTYIHNHINHNPDRCWLYASESYLKEFVGTNKLIIKRLWDADWSSNGDFHEGEYWTIARQRSGDGYGPGPHTLPGIGGSVCDVDELSPQAMSKPSH